MVKVKEITELECGEFEKGMIASAIKDYLAENPDYINGNIEVRADQFERVHIIFYEGCAEIPNLNELFDEMFGG